MEDMVAVIAKNEGDALDIMRDLQNEFIIGAFDEDFTEVDNKENALKLVEKDMLCVNAVFANGSFEDKDDIVDRIISKLDSYMADDDKVFTYAYEVA